MEARKENNSTYTLLKESNSQAIIFYLPIKTNIPCLSVKYRHLYTNINQAGSYTSQVFHLSLKQ